MKICILETDRPPADLQARHGSFADMFERWLGPALPEARFSRVYVAADAPLPANPADFDGYLITGSRAGVYEDHPWIAPLAAFLRRAGAAGVPLAGVCFGHQMLAHAFGGAVRRAEAGWVIGHQTHAPTDEGRALFGPAPVGALSFHRDQIVALPPGTRRLLSNPRSPNGGLRYRDMPALSVQFHPEFDPAFVADLLDAAAGIRVPEPLAAEARAGLGAALDNARVARGFAAFLRRADTGPA